MNLIKNHDAFLDEGYETFVHESGMEVHILPKNIPEYFMSIGVKYGSFTQEWGGKTIPLGCAHFMEHMIFHKADGGDYSDDFAKWGASVNACTANEYTAYFCSGTKGKYRSLSTLLTMVTHPSFQEEDVERERLIIAQEIALYKDDVAAVLYLKAMECLYRHHPIRQDICGSYESIAAIDSLLLKNIHQIFYHTSNLILTVTGNFQVGRIKNILDKLLPPTKTKPPVTPTVPPDISQNKTNKQELYLDVATTQVLLGYKDPVCVYGKEQSRHGYIGEIVCRAIFSQSAALFRLLKERNLCSKDFTGIYEWTDGCGHILISATTAQPKELCRQIAAYLSQISRTTPFGEKEFQRAKNVLFADTVRIFDYPEDLTLSYMEERLSSLHFYDIPKMIESITYEEFLAFIETIFKNEAGAIVCATPKTPKKEEQTT